MKCPKYKLVTDFNEWKKNNPKMDVWAIHNSNGEILFDVTEEDYTTMLDKGMVEDGYLTKDYSDEELITFAELWGILWTDKDPKNIVKHIDFNDKMKKLHEEMCDEIAFLMRKKHVMELDLLETETRRTAIQMESKDNGETIDVIVKKVFLRDSPGNPTYGEVYVTSVDWGYTGDEISIKHNRYVLPCSLLGLYETIYEELETKGHKQ